MKYLVVLLIFSISLSAQIKNIAGRILNSETNQPVAFCNVLVNSKSLQTVTNSNGEFNFNQPIWEADTLTFSHIGFEPKSILVSDFVTIAKKVVYLKSKIYSSQTIMVKGIIASEGSTPISFSKIKREELIKNYSVQDIPEILSFLPSVNYYSENGNGIGYNYLSIRGFDQRRISVAINGIPQNEPEDHNVYWIDFPDLLDNTELIQVQRGAGSGIIGYPAIGGSINIITSTFSDKARLNASSSFGSYNTRKFSVSFSSGLVENKYSFSAKLSQILSSGYRDMSWVDLKAYHFSAVRFDDKLTTQLNLYGGPIADGLAYTGLPKFAIKDKQLRRANFSYWESDGKQITYSSTRRSDEIENFSQPHFELLNEYKLNDSLILNSALFLVLGNGFFDYDGSWADSSYFRLTHENGFNSNSNPGNALIRAMVENKQWGWIPKINIKHANGELIVGGEFRFHRSLHWGNINYAENLTNGITKDFRYYQYQGAKDILSFYVNENYILNDKVNLLAEAQISYNKYHLYNEKYLNTDFVVKSTFINPRLGINYKLNSEINTYASIALVSRDPRLKNYYDAGESSGGALPQFKQNSDGSYDFNSPLVKPESMKNLEVGTSFLKNNLGITLNGYYMQFDDEIVKKGQLDRFGQPITGNMDQTIHYGAEVTLNYKIDNGIEFILNGSLSKNYISKGIEFVNTKNVNGDYVTTFIDLSNNSISGFPSSYFSGIVKYNYDNTFVQLSARYVSKFYTDNYGDKLSSLLKIFPSLTDYNDNVVESFFVVNLFASLDIHVDYLNTNAKLFIQINNLFDNLYAANGIGGEFFPAAERNFLFGLKLSL